MFYDCVAQWNGPPITSPLWLGWTHMALSRSSTTSVTFTLYTTWWKAPTSRWFQHWGWGCTQGSQGQWEISLAQGMQLWGHGKGGYTPGGHHLSLSSQYTEQLPRACGGDQACQNGMGESKYGIWNLIGTDTRNCKNSKSSTYNSPIYLISPVY